MANTIKKTRSSDAVIGGQPHQSLITELDLMLRARYPLVYIVSSEEDPVDEVLNSVATQSNSDRKILTWDLVRGWSDNGADKDKIMGALTRIAKADEQESTIFVLRDIHYILKQPETVKNQPVIREIKNLTKN